MAAFISSASPLRLAKSVPDACEGSNRLWRRRPRGGARVTAVLSSPSDPKAYSADQITVLEGLEPVRKRPGMYIGSTGPKGLHHLVYEVVDNAVDEALAGYASQITVRISPGDVVSVEDDGRGIPVEVHSRTGKSALETVMTVLHAGGKFDSESYKVSGGLHGVGISVVNALSEETTVSVWRQGKRYSMSFVRGSVVSDGLVCEDVESEADNTKTGTLVTFKPDPQIFKTTTVFELDTLGTRLRELAFLNAGLKIQLIDDRPETPISCDYFCEGGLVGYVDYLVADKEKLYPEVLRLGPLEKDDVTVEIALCWCKDAYSDTVLGFANSIKTTDGGSHLDGFKTALTRTLNSLARQMGKLKEGTPNLSGDFLREGLTAIVAVKVPDPEFEGQTKSRLGNPEVRSIVDNILSNELLHQLERNPKYLSDVIEKALAAYQAADAAKRARDLVRRKNLLESSTLPGKLADCSSRKPESSEIYIVEGDSAGGTAKQARDRTFQAILPLRGKILNIEKTDDARIYKNSEIQALITALGLGVKGEEFSSSQLRYHRIVIMTDADVDGAHIRTLLLTFFYRYQRRLLEEGYIFIACPPLYKVEKGKSQKYFHSDDGMRAFVQELGSSKHTVQRFKGLGELMPIQLWDTTMNPQTRVMKKVEVADGAEADQIFSILMGDKVEPRREFIETHAETLSFDDIDF